MRSTRIVLSFLAVALLICPVVFSADDGFSALVAAYENPELGPPIRVDNLNLAYGHLQLRLGSGNVAPLLVGGAPVGLFFSGQGSVAYRAADPLEREAVLFNLDKGTRLKPVQDEEGVLIEDNLTQVLVWAPGHELPQLPEQAGTPLTEELAKHRKKFADVRLTPALHLLIKQRLDAAAQPVVRAEITGELESYVYTADPIVEQEEVLHCLRRKTPYVYRGPSGSVWTLALSRQAIDRDPKEFLQPSFLLTEVDVSLTAHNDGKAQLKVTETIVPQLRHQRVFQLNLYSYRYDEAKQRDVNLRLITDAAGQEVPFHHAEHDLLVVLPQPAAPNQGFKLTFHIDGDFLIHPNGNSYWRLGGPWFPQPNLSGQYYTVHSLVKVEDPFIPLVPGDTIRNEQVDGFTLLETKIDKPVQFFTVLAGKYEVHEEIFEGGLTIRIASYAEKNKSAMKKLTNLAYKMIGYYEQWLGPFPFREFNIIEIYSYGWGQAPPATMFITREAFRPLMREVAEGVNHRFAHEIAHQYWGYVVKMGSAEQQWVVESFAEYSSALTLKRLFGKGRYQTMVTTWKSNAKLATDDTSIAMANRIAGTTRDSGAHRQILVYDKGAYLLACLHKELGDDAFATFMRSAQGVFAWRFVTTDHLAELLQHITKKDYRPLFDATFWGTEMPVMGK